MSSSGIKKTIANYVDQDMVFSAKILYERLPLEERSEFWKFQYANILRMCTLFSESEKAFKEIEIQKIPEKERYFYYLYLAQLYMDIGRNEEAQRQLKICMEFEESDTVPFVFISSILLGENNNDDAIVYLKRALNKKGNIDEVYYNLATRYLVKGDYVSAMRHIDYCLTIDPNYPNAQNVKRDISEVERLTLLQ